MVAISQFTGSRRNLGAIKSENPSCSVAMTKGFTDNLSAASSGCTAKSDYEWDGTKNPTDAQRAAICKCDVEPFNVPKCYWLKEGQYEMDTPLHFDYVYNCSKISGKSTPKVVLVNALDFITTTATPTPTPTLTPTSTPATTMKASDVMSTVANPTNKPSAAAANLSDCSVQQLNAFGDSLYKESNQCMGGSSSWYNWGGNANPTEAQYEQICKCKKVNEFGIPNCSIQKGPDIVSLPEHYVWVTKTECAKKTSSSSSNVGMIVGIAGAVVVVLLIVAFVLYRRNRKGKQEDTQPKFNANAVPSPTPAPAVDFQLIVTPQNARSRKSIDRRTSAISEGSRPTMYSADESFRPSDSSTHRRSTTRRSATGSRGSNAALRHSESATWDDPAIIAVRIPYDSLFLGSVLSSGGFGEVYQGTYRGEIVAIKKLLPARCKDLSQIDYFLGEVKLMASLNHERIVKFIGVAWNSLSDACLVVEYMENGDLRSVLTRWDDGAEKRKNGFDADKIKIALHIAHGLVYLHSLKPVVVHRDLKSKNVLLHANYDAKLMDFGISRERADSTMTANVGSSLWMAPEVMMGNRYDEKADIFSFGVVLSELDTHQLPYFHAKTLESGQKIPEAAILQQVMLGRVSVDFSDRADPDLVQLGRECVSLDPKARPTTAMVLHRVHQVMRHYK